MSDTSLINKPLSSGSYNSPERLNSEEVQIPFPHPNNPGSQQCSSQNAKEDSSSANHPFHGQTFLCPHNLMIACSCCSQQLKQRHEDPAMKSFEKLYQDSLEKAHALEGSLGDFKEEIRKLQNKVEDITDPIKKTVQNWFEASVRILCSIRKSILRDLDQAKQQLFDKGRFTKEITGMESQIMVLKEGFENFEEFQNAYTKEASSQFEIQKKMMVIEKLSNSLKNPDVNDLKKRLNEIVFFDDQAIKKVRIPAFINVILYQLADMDASTMVSSLSLSSRL